MNQLVKAQERAYISVAEASELSRMAGTQGQDVFAREDVEDQIGAGPLILDGLRRRPHYFDGRFLTGADLTRDQDYIRQRQADMARSGGSGVISGLQVRSLAQVRGQTLRIGPGVGLTPSGDVVMITQQRDVPLLDLPLTRQLDAALGLRQEPRVSLGRRTGIFVLALRAVEFTANPIAAYPRTITGKRTVEDGDIIEATAVTLIPFPETSGAANLTAARRSLAKQIFTGEPKGLPQDALPLAMIAVERGTIRWIDVAMVRRETGMDSGVQVAFGGRPRAISEAHLLQHRAHLGDVLAEFLSRGLPPLFPAAHAFAALPPAGQLPAAAVQPDEFGFRQIYFPPTVDADIAFVPTDELGALVEESLALPPIDLEAPAADLDATGVLVLVPVSRGRFQRFSQALGATMTSMAGDAGAGATRPALDLISRLAAKRRKQIEAEQRDSEAEGRRQAEELKVKAWHAAFHEAIAALPQEGGRPPLLWYTRRRTVAYQTRLAGVGVAVSGDDVVIGAVVNSNLERLKLDRRVAKLSGTATPQATARMVSLLGAPAIAGSDILTAAVVADLERVAASDAGAADSAAPRAPGRIRIPGVRPASTDVAVARAGLERIALAAAEGVSTSVRADTPLNLSEGEVMDVADDYSDARVGEGLARLDRALGEEWPDAKTAIWIGESGKALAVDSAFRSVPGEKLKDFAGLMRDSADKKDGEAIDRLLEKMR
ncbi:MAG TPA: hypothetical protein VFQ67_07300 [Allosphingosinicella sp.]|jgi:hypothetical protein|nr:hypothetical protein [Allosphingosinicella sp.]